MSILNFYGDLIKSSEPYSSLFLFSTWDLLKQCRRISDGKI